MASKSKRIKLTQGKYAIVDAEDFDRLNKFKWCVSRSTEKHLYASAFINGKKTFMHRFIINAPKKSFTDHVNGNGLDNRKSNLRVCTNSQNVSCSKFKKNTSHTSKYRGVHFDKNRTSKNKWRAVIHYNGKIIHIGDFDNEVDAAKSYNKSAIKYHGDFAHLNKIPSSRKSA